MIVSNLLLILHKKYSFISLCLKPEMWQKVAKFKGTEYFRKALYITDHRFLLNTAALDVKRLIPDIGIIYTRSFNILICAVFLYTLLQYTFTILYMLCALFGVVFFNRDCITIDVDHRCSNQYFMAS